MTRENFHSPRHFYRGARDIARKKIACVESTCPYVEIMEDRVVRDVTKKHAEIGHVFTCLCSVFLMSDMTNFR